VNAPTSKEQEVLDALLSGLTAPEIAKALGRSHHVVDHALRRWRLRHHVGTTLGLVAKILNERLEAVTGERDACLRSLAVLDRRRSC
jgi:DNA-binding NarL/FixJ family response regulator